MTKQIDTLISDIYSLFEGEELFNDKLFENFGHEVRNIMASRFKEQRGQNNFLRMSNLGRPDRQLWFDVNGNHEREAIPAYTKIKFSYGDLIEQLVLLYAKMAGHSVEREQEQVELDGIKGHIDAVIDGVLVDVKSASTFSFAKFETGSLFLAENDPFGYVAQMCGYLAATGLKRGGFIAVDKTLGKICWCEIPQEVIERYNVKRRIAHLKQVVASEEMPPRCFSDVPDGKSGNRKLATGCSYCPHKFVCWPNLRVFAYSTGPKFFTHIVKEPRVSEFPD